MTAPDPVWINVYGHDGKPHRLGQYRHRSREAAAAPPSWVSPRRPIYRIKVTPKTPPKAGEVFS